MNAVQSMLMQYDGRKIFLLPVACIVQDLLLRDAVVQKQFDRAADILRAVFVDCVLQAVIVSGFDPVRREIARLALEKLITDGRAKAIWQVWFAWLSTSISSVAADLVTGNSLIFTPIRTSFSAP